MWRVYHYFGGRVVTIGIAGGWTLTHRLRDTFLEPGNDSTGLERTRYARTYILEMIGGYLMSDLSQNLVHLRWLLKLVDFRAAGEFSWESAVLATLYREMCRATLPNKAKIGASYVRIPIAFEDIWLLLDQRLKAQMQETDRVLRQFRFRQLIPEAPEVLDDEHKIDLRQTNTNWSVFFSKYIKIWKNLYDYIPTREPITVPESACTSDYMQWFRTHGKPYLLLKE
ncbi:hypothetical protein Golax_023043 [Gossypium laxum]|uniref:Aminotransferase-like plant mobile domain-containing protein n=2 Tax=Gossypium TaxID=3633 RepID=A0A7J9B107_9ROSI|nr:hypothetical protein [Gossypium laxum]